MRPISIVVFVAKRNCHFGASVGLWSVANDDGGHDGHALINEEMDACMDNDV